MRLFLKPLLAFAIFQLFTSISFGYFVATKDGFLRPAANTHVIVLGDGEDLYDLFVKAAATKAEKLMAINPSHQILLMGPSSSSSFARKLGFKVVKEESAAMTDIVMQNMVRRVSRIASVDVYAHANAVMGSLLQKEGWQIQFLFEADPVWTDVRVRMMPFGYIMLHGCNTGLVMGPALAQATGIPVIGTMTGSNFQTPYNHGLWMFDSSKEAVKTNRMLAPPFLEATSLKCSSGFCLRLKAENSAYHGYWGDWSQGGFPSFKVFCGNLHPNMCSRGISQAIIDYPSSIPLPELANEEGYRKQVLDYLCPDSSLALKKSCMEELEAISSGQKVNPTYSPFKGKTLNCTMKKCDAYFECGSFARAFSPGSCELINTNKSPSTAFVNEYLFLINAYKQRVM